LGQLEIALLLKDIDLSLEHLVYQWLKIQRLNHDVLQVQFHRLLME
jgi:hypothetical protein